MKICANCGTECEDRMKFCLNCGAPFAQPAEESVPAAEEVAPAAAENWPEQIEEEVPAIQVPVDDEKTEVMSEEAAQPAAAPAEPEQTVQQAVEVPVKEAPAAASVKEESAKPKKKAVQYVEKEEEEEEEYVPASLKPMSFLATLAIIFAIIGVFSGGYACVISFMSIPIALAFLAPSVLGILFGCIAVGNTGKRAAKKGKTVSVIAIVISILAIALWIAATIMLKKSLMADFGNADMMTVVRALLAK